MVVTCTTLVAVAVQVCQPVAHTAACVWTTVAATWRQGPRKVAALCRCLTVTAAGCSTSTATTIACVDRVALMWTPRASFTLPISEMTALRSSPTCRTNGRHCCHNWTWTLSSYTNLRSQLADKFFHLKIAQQQHCHACVTAVNVTQIILPSSYHSICLCRVWKVILKYRHITFLQVDRPQVGLSTRCPVTPWFSTVHQIPSLIVCCLQKILLIVQSVSPARWRHCYNFILQLWGKALSYSHFCVFAGVWYRTRAAWFGTVALKYTTVCIGTISFLLDIAAQSCSWLLVGSPSCSLYKPHSTSTGSCNSHDHCFFSVCY